jgi:hypothetical protein
MPIDERRRDDITAAVAAYNVAARGPLLPPAATRLLTVLFADADACQRSIASLAQEGFDSRNLLRLLARLIAAGLVSKEPGLGSLPNVYRLHLPAVRP